MRRTLPRLASALPGGEYTPEPYTGASLAETVARRQKYVHPVLTWLYGDKPLHLVQGKMQYVWDSEGKRYLDMYGGVTTTSVGHCHPRVVEAATDQLKKVWHTTSLYFNDNTGLMAEYMVSKMPKEHEWVVFFTNSGGESTEFAILSAKMHTKNYDYITLRNGYHGIGSAGARGATASPGWRWKTPADPSVRHALCPDPHNGMFPANPVEGYLNDLRCMIKDTCSTVAGFGAENIQGVGGCLELPKGYIKGAYEIIREAGGVCVSDEVQTGFGRLGDCYWGFDKDHDGVCPDMIVCAKSIGNGWPLGAVVVKKEIAESMCGTNFFNTFGGNPVATAVGLETLKIIDEEDLQGNCRVLGERFLSGFATLQADHPTLIKSIRGRGLMLGLEFANPDHAGVVLSTLYTDHSLLVGRGGPTGSVLRIKPPMCINEKDVDYTLECLAAVLKKIEQA